MTETRTNETHKNLESRTSSIFKSIAIAGGIAGASFLAYGLLHDERFLQGFGVGILSADGLMVLAKYTSSYLRR